MGFALVAAALAPLALAGCGDEAEPAARGSVTMDELRPCGGLPKIPGFRCGSIEVPFEREEASLGKTKIGFAVRQRDDRDRPSRGAIFAVEGGPGYSSTGTANAYVKLFGNLLRRHELVLVDQRGQGRSELIDCPDLQKGRGPDWLTLPECARRLGDRAMSYRTSAAADDIDDVRRALGLGKIALYGDSYGTFLGQSYAYRHGDTLNALVLDSAYPVEGEDPWYPSLPRTGVRSMSIACERSDECTGDAGRRLERVVDHLRDTGRGVGDLIDAIAEAGSGPDAAKYYLDVDEAGQALLAGDPKPWRKLTQEFKPAFHHPRFYLRAGELAVSCNDYPMIWDKEASEAERRRQLEEAIRDYDRDAFPPYNPREVALQSELGYLMCITWPQPGEHYEPPKPEGAKAPNVPTLVVAGELDDITTPIEGRWVAREFPNSEYYLARNNGHVSSLYDSQAPEAKRIRSFLAAEIGG
ncbi:MAG: alpha/beta hydrolase [Solirubrobacterales bacterium]